MNMNQKGFANIIIVIGIIVVVAIASFFFLRQRSGAPSTTSQQPTPTNNQSAPVTISDLCIAEKDKIIDLVNIFENDQVKRDARSVLALFTSTELPGDSSTYVHLSGSDAAGPRLYSSGQTNFNQPAFKILEGPSKNASGSCTTKVQEQRSYYPEGVGGDFGPAQPYTVYFVTVKQNNSWKIDSYLSDSGSTHKYSGWGY